MQRPGRKKPLKQRESVPETEEVTRGGGGPAWLSGQVDSISVALNVRGTITKSSQVEPHWRAHTHTDAHAHARTRTHRGGREGWGPRSSAAGATVISGEITGSLKWMEEQVHPCMFNLMPTTRK